MIKILFLLISLHSMTILACDKEGYFFPKNNLSIPTDQKNTGINEVRFNAIIDEFQEIYTPIFKERGSIFKINKNWKSSVVNARAHRSSFTRFVTMYGGMARHPEMNELGFALVICHEIGHHLGGAPKADPIMSSEGQSDYFASTKCMRRYLRTKALQAPSNNLIAKEKCSAVYSNQTEIEHCMLTAEGGISLSRIFAQLTNLPMPRLDTPDQSVARRTNYRHPGAQCRLDTYFAGALCENDIDIAFSSSDASIGGCHPLNGDTVGMRPACWFRMKN